MGWIIRDGTLITEITVFDLFKKTKVKVTTAIIYSRQVAIMT